MLCCTLAGRLTNKKPHLTIVLADLVCNLMIFIKTGKSKWTANDIRIEKIARFLEQHGPHF